MHGFISVTDSEEGVVFVINLAHIQHFRGDFLGTGTGGSIIMVDGDAFYVKETPSAIRERITLAGGKVVGPS